MGDATGVGSRFRPTTAIAGTTGTDWADPAHDRNGNMTTIPNPANLAAGLTAIYDAWNRLVEVKDGQTVIARYEYDGLNRRIESHIDSGAPSNPTGIDTHVHYYHNSAWQILETRQSDTESAQPETLQPKHQYVWSQRYIDAAVLRDENTNSNGLCDDQRLYYLNDANFNVTALLDTSGEALERYVYSPYGVVTIYDATWTNTRSASSYANLTLYTGRELDAETGLHYYRNRYYGAELGRFVSRDPIGYGARRWNLSEYVDSSPLIHSDPSGERRLPTGGCLIPDVTIRFAPLTLSGLDNLPPVYVEFACTCPWKLGADGCCYKPQISTFSRWEPVKGLQEPNAPLHLLAEYYYCVCEYIDGTRYQFIAQENVVVVA